MNRNHENSMDPNEDYKRMMEAFGKRKYKKAWSHYCNLTESIQRGSFLPSDPAVQPEDMLSKILDIGRQCAIKS